MTMIKKKYRVLKDGILFLNGGEIAVSTIKQENTFSEQWFSSQDQFDKQVANGLIEEVRAES